MELKIYGKDGNLKLTASPGSSSTLAEEVMGECSVSASFTHTTFVPLDVNDYTEVLGVKYKIRSPYRPAQKNTQTYQYQVKLYAPIHDAEDALMLYTADGDIRSEFSYDGGPREHLQLWADNMNRIAGGTLWTIGTVITGGNKTIDYNNMSCWDAAFGSSGIAAAFETEMWADGFVINLCKASRGETVELGYLQGLTQLSQEDNGDVKFFTRLFPLGSTRNIDASKYGHARLQLPSGAAYVDKNTELYGVKEAYEEAAFADIYPQYTGTVTSVRTEEKENEEGRKYTVYYFKDSSMAFNPMDYQIPDLTFMLAFQTGDLAGRGNGEDGSFEAAWHEDTSEWEITNVYPDETAQIPGGSIVPNAGDTYIPWNFTLPQQYITAAEQAYAEAVDDFLDTYSFDTKKYNGTTDRNYIERNGTSLALGQNVRLLSEEYFAAGYKDTRIVKCVRKLNDLSQATVTCTDQIGTGWKTSVDNQLSDLHYILTKQEQQTLIDIIKTGDNKTPSDYNVFSALKALSMFLRKDKEDATNYLLRMLGGAHFFPFTQGMIGGSGAAFYKNAAGKTYMEADGAYLRDELIVPQITFNCIDVISGDKANTFAFGTIKSVDTENKTAELDLLEDQTGTLHVDDICRGVFHNLDGSNLQDDMEDANGFYGYAGFSTSYFTPTEIITNEPGRMVFRYSLQAGTSVHPMKGMNFFAYGNFTDKTRQSITYETRYYTRRLKDVNTWVIDPTKNISMQDGLLEGLTIGGMVMHGYGTFQENCYFTGVNIQFTPETEDALKGQDAYNVSLSSYERTVKVDENGNFSALTFTKNVVTGDKNVITGDENVVTSGFMISTYIQAFKGETELLYSTSVEPGKYIASLNAHGCTAHIDAGSVVIDSITDYNECYVDIEVNCEGNVVFNKIFSISVIRDGYEGSSPVVLDLDNEMASVACDAEGNVTAGLPIVSTASLYYGTEKLVLDSLDLAPTAGVTQVSINKGTGQITIKTIASYAPDVISVPVTCSGTYNGQSYERTAYIKISKVKPGANGENAVIYSIMVEPSAIKVDKNGNLSASSVSCKVKKTDGNSSSVIESLPEGYSIRMYIDGESIGIYTKLPVTTSVNNAMQSVGFQLINGSEIMDEETVPVVHDGLDGLGSVTLDLDNEMASVACDEIGNVVNGLPITIGFSMYFGTEKMTITSITNNSVIGVSVTNSASGSSSTITSISASAPETIELEYTVKGTHEGNTYERKAVFRVLKIQAGENGKDGENAVIYQLFPSLNVIQVNKNGSYVNTSISCWLTKNDGGTVSTVTVLPSGMTMAYQRDGGSEIQIGPGDAISTTSVSSKLVFKLYKDNVLADMETVPVVKDGKDGQDGQNGQDGRPGSDGTDGKQGIQGCVIRTSIWTTGREYRNDSAIDDDSVIRYIDVAMVRNNSYSTGWRAYLCLRTHTSSSSIGVSNTTYWSEFSQNVTAILTDLIIAKNAQLQFMQGNQLLIQKDDGTVTAGISGSTSGDKIRFWAGAEEPDTAPFRVDEEGNLIAQNGRFEGVIAGTLESLKTAGGEIDLDADKAWFNGIDLQNQGTVDGRPLRFYSSSIWCRNQFGAYGRITARVLTNSVYYYPNGTDKATTIYNMTAKTSTSGQRYYSIPCYGGLDDTPDNIAGMPVDTIVLSNSGSYYYELELGPTQRVFVLHANDDASSGSYIYVNGQAVAVQGGGSIIVQAIPSAWVKPSVASSTLGANQVVISEHDFNW